MIQLVHVERIQERLRLLPGVVDSQQRREFRFPELVLLWLNETESVLEDAHLHSVSQLAALRSQLLTAMHRADNREGPQTGRRKHYEAVASRVLQRAQEVLSAALERRIEQIREAEQVAGQVIAVARAKGILQQASRIQSHRDAVNFVYARLCEDPDTAGPTLSLSGVLGPLDVLVILDRAMPELMADGVSELGVVG